MPELGKGSRGPKANLATPEAFPIPPPQLPRADDLGSIQRELGKLAEAVEMLKEQSKLQGAKLEASAADIHAAKVIVRVLLALGVAAATFLGFIGKAALDYFSRLPAK